MQKNTLKRIQKIKTFAFRSDLRAPLIICSSIGGLLLLFLLAVTLLTEDAMLSRNFTLAAAAVYAVAVGVILATQLRRYMKVRRANDEAEAMSSELADVFRYVADIPYAVVSDKGVVKIVSTALQNILQTKNPVCNIPLSSFCKVPMPEIIACAYNGSQLRDVTFTKDGVPIDRTKPMEVELGGRKYNLRCYVLRSHGKDYYFVIFNDVTALDNALKSIYRNEPVVAYIVIDSLMELTQYVRVNYRTAVVKIEERLKEWVDGFGGMLLEYEREKYLLVMTREALDGCVAAEFPILDTIRSIPLGDSSFPVSVSIGVGAVHGNFRERAEAAANALDVALQKGGDQAAVDIDGKVTFYGGRVNTMAAQTSITSRVNSLHLCELFREAGNVLIMGHSSPDYDSVGSCIGLARLAMCARGDASNIRVVVDREHFNFRMCYDMIAGIPEYRSMFISADTAMDAVRTDTLLVLSDVNSAFKTAAPKLLKCIRNIVIVDHHRRQDQAYEFKPLMTYIRPAVSSASELVSEMLEFSPYHDKLLKEEANVMLAGMMLDTKNFTASVGAQTFSAVHYLYERGAHASVVRRFFSETIENIFLGSDIDSHTRIYRDRIALTWLSIDRAATEADEIAIAKAADKLMTVEGIDASFAILRAESQVTISARSHNKINVQIIMQRLGGGGHYDMAGAKIVGSTLEEACRMLKREIDGYLDRELAQASGDEK